MSRSPRRCRWCREEFIPGYRRSGQFCSAEHAEMMRNPPRVIPKTCKWCCGKFSITLGYGSPPSSVPTQLYCSKQCKLFFEYPSRVPQTRIVFCGCGKVEPLPKEGAQRELCTRCTRVRSGAMGRVKDDLGMKFQEMSTELRDAATNRVLGMTLKIRAKDILKERSLGPQKQ